MIYAVARKRVKSNICTLDPADTVISSAADHGKPSTRRATWLQDQIPEGTIRLFHLFYFATRHDNII